MGQIVLEIKNDFKPVKSFLSLKTRSLSSKPSAYLSHLWRMLRCADGLKLQFLVSELKNDLKSFLISRTSWRLQNFLCTVEPLYCGHALYATFSRNQLSQATVKLLHFEPLYSGHLSIADNFSVNQWYPVLRGFTVLRRKNYVILHLFLHRTTAPLII